MIQTITTIMKGLLFSFLLIPFLSQAQQQSLLPGDLLFYKDTTGMGKAVKESTGEYTHVALVTKVGDTVWIIDASHQCGVCQRPLDKGVPLPDAYRLTIPFDTVAVISRAESFLGLPYDNAFLPDNNAMYCSELIYVCFPGVFESKPMNWRDSTGAIPEYWRIHFDQLGMPIPEGVQGTNPTDLSKSPYLKKL